MDDFFDEGVFLRNDIRFITAVQDVVDVVDGIFGRNLRILFKELQGMPAMIVQVRIFIVQKVAHGVDAVFHFIAVDHGKFTVMVVLMIGLIRMVVDEPVRMDVVLMMDSGMEQDAQAAAFQGRYGDDRHAEHFRQTVQVDFHTPLLDDIHHIQGDDDGLAQFQELQGQVEIAFQGRCIDDVDDDVDIVTEDEITRNLFFHGIRRQAVRPGQVDEVDVITVGIDGAFDLFDGDAGPVGHFEVGPGVGIEQSRLAAVRVADESDCHFLLFHLGRCLRNLCFSRLRLYFASHDPSPLLRCATKSLCPKPGGYCAS